jgi:hypothetical protein
VFRGALFLSVFLCFEGSAVTWLTVHSQLIKYLEYGSVVKGRVFSGEQLAGIYGLVHEFGTYGREFANIHGFEYYSTFRPKSGEGEVSMRCAFGVAMRARQEADERFGQWRVDSWFSGILIALTRGARLERAPSVNRRASSAET